MKKVLSLVLVIAMVLSSMSFAFASTFEDVTGDYEKAIDALSALGVINGYEDGTFRPENTLKRAELAKLLVEALGYGNLVGGATGAFSDTNGHWAEGYISIAAGTGLVNGYPDGTFKPEATLTYDEVFAMVIRALGYTEASLKGNWPTNYKVKAIDLGLDDDVVLGTGSDRGGVAQVLYNALDEDIVQFDNDGLMTSTGRTLIDNIATLKEYYYVGVDRFDEDDSDYAGDKVDLTPYVYQYLHVYVNDDDEVVFIKSNKSKTLTGTVDSVDEENAQIVVKDANGDKYTINAPSSEEITAYYNGEQTSIEADDFDEMLYRGGNNLEATITVVSRDSLSDIKAGDSNSIKSGDTADHFIVTRASKGILVDTDYVEGKTKISGVDGSISLPKDSNNDVDLDKITVTGAVDSLEDIAEDDVVIAYESADGAPVKLVVVRDSIEGEVTKTADDQTTVYVDGTKYSLSRVNNSVRYDERPEVGNEGIFYFDDAGKIFAVDTDGAELTDYAIVLSSASGDWSGKMDGSVTDNPQIKLLTQDGETVVYDVLVTIDENELDDYAKYTDDENDVEDEKLVALGALDTSSKGAITIVPTFETNQLVKYSIDEDGYIDEIEMLETVLVEDVDTDDIEDIAAENAIVFDIENKDVVAVANLNDGDHRALYKNGEIIVFVSGNVKAASDDIFGVITNVAKVKNASGKTVQEITAFVDGEEVVYIAETNAPTFSKPTTATTNTAVEFDFGTDDELDSVKSIDNAYVNDGTDVTVYSKYIEIGGKEYTFAKDVAVYIYDKSAKEWSIGDISDLDDDEPTVAYNTAKTSGIINIVVQIQP